MTSSVSTNIPHEHEVRPIAPPGRDRDRGSRGPVVPPWAIIGAVLVAVVVVLAVIGGHKGNSTSTTSSHAAESHHDRGSHHQATAKKHSKHTMVQLQLTPTGAVYVCLVNGNGRKLIPGVIYDTGQTIPTEGGRKLLLTLGNASVQMKVNGVTVPVAPSSGAIGYELLPDSHHLLPAGSAPSCA